MTELTERLRNGLAFADRTDAADEIDRLQATVAGLQKSASLRVQFHAAELADVIAERDMRKDTLAQRDRELANARAIDIHSCHDGCTRAGCVAAGLREDAERYRWLRSQDWFCGPLCVIRDPKRVLTRGSGLGADCPSGDRLDTAIDEARKVAP